MTTKTCQVAPPPPNPRNLIIARWRGQIRSVIDTKESDGIANPLEKITIKSPIAIIPNWQNVNLIDTKFVILLQCNKMTK